MGKNGPEGVGGGGRGSARTPTDTPWPQTHPPAQVHSCASDGEHLRSADACAPSPPASAQSHVHCTLSTWTLTLRACGPPHVSARHTHTCTHMAQTLTHEFIVTHTVTQYQPHPHIPTSRDVPLQLHPSPGSLQAKFKGAEALCQSLQ